MQQVLVLNASYEPLNVCSLRRAHVLVFKGKAEVLEELDRPLCSATRAYVWPHVIRLLHYVRVPRIVQRKISRRALFARDGWRCVYCGTQSGRLTLDHVIPRSRGGGDGPDGANECPCFSLGILECPPFGPERCQIDHTQTVTLLVHRYFAGRIAQIALGKYFTLQLVCIVVAIIYLVLERMASSRTSSRLRVGIVVEAHGGCGHRSSSGQRDRLPGC